ncbi:MAG: hypothetical protein H7Y01_04655, partial [Ferruginibacter sp.]|nr:hypothetical protein [Chitinophagaceae bacterium]
MKQFLFFICFLSQGLIAEAQPCASIILPQLAENTRKDFEQNLALAKNDYEKDTVNADAIIWYGRRTAYLGDYMKAIDIFSRGINLHPGDARLYRHRGHRFITVRCFDKAIADFKKAAVLVRGKPDEVEPDGLPNAKNIPTSTLQSNIWYHLGLAYFIKGGYKKAVKAYEKGIAVSKNPDMYVAMVNWINLALREQKKFQEAFSYYNRIEPGAELLESRDYKNLLEMYKHKLTEKEVELYAAGITGKDQALASATVYFGVGYYCLLIGHKQKAVEFFEKAIGGGQW